MTRAFCYTLDFAGEDWDDLTFEDATKARRDTTDGLRLTATYDEARRRRTFPTSGGPWYVEVPEIVVGAFRGFLAVDAAEDVVTDVPEALQPETLPDTPIGYQVLVDGDPYYWDGAAWAVAGATDTNDLDDLQDHVANTDLRDLVLAAGGSFGLRIHLSTDDADYSPQVTRLTVLVDVGTAQALDDLVHRTLVPVLEALEIEGTLQDVMPADDDALDLFAEPWRRGRLYRYSSIRAVYDLTDDPSRTTDLYAGGFVASTQAVDGETYTGGTVALSAVVPEGNTVEVQFRHRPVVSVHTHRDFYETGTVPEIQIREPQILEEVADTPSEVVGQRTDPGAGVDDGYRVTGARTLLVALMLAPRADDPVDLDALGGALRAWADRTRLLTSVQFGTRVAFECTSAGNVNVDDPGMVWRYDLAATVYNARDPGIASATKLVRTPSVTWGAGPLR